MILIYLFGDISVISRFISGNIATELKISLMSKSIPISDLIPLLRSGMEEFGYSESVIANYVNRMRDLHEYMEHNGIHIYDEDVGDSYYAKVLNNESISLNRKNDLRKSIRMVNHLILGLPFVRALGRCRAEHIPPKTVLGEYVNEFLNVVREQKYSTNTIKSHERCLSYFAKAMNANDVRVSDLNSHIISCYIGSLQSGRQAMAHSLRKFLSYLYSKQLTEYNLALGLYRVKDYRSTPVLTFYTPEEVAKIEGAVDRSTKKGKRDYAIILLASRLGMRSSDIERLKFSDLDWDRNEIHFIQYKTNRKITLPLLSDVGDAIIDYTLHGRPKTKNVKEIFVCSSMPYKPMQTLSTVASKYIRLADIDVNGRHRGLHSLRHSLATALINEGNDVHVISSVLGHRSSDSTMCYLGIDLNNLLACSQDVTLPSDDFYTQRGGIFYER